MELVHSIYTNIVYLANEFKQEVDLQKSEISMHPEKATENQTNAEILQCSVLLQNAYTAVFEFIRHIVERCNQLNDPSGSYLMPDIMFFVERLASHQDVTVGSRLEEKRAIARSSLLNHYITFLNKLLANGSVFIDEYEYGTCFSNGSCYDECETINGLALSEEFPDVLVISIVNIHSLLVGGAFSIDGNKHSEEEGFSDTC